MNLPLKNVVIVGGTHGNEPTGTYLLDKWSVYKQGILRSTFETELLLANPKAVSFARRFVDRDLNRSFLATDLGDNRLHAYEDLLAKTINQMIEAKYDLLRTLIIDMHTTTSNMGITLICDSNRHNIELACAVKRQVPEVRIYIFDNSDRIRSCLRSISKYGIGIEIGPVPQNVLRHDILVKMEQVVGVILDVAEELNTQGELGLDPETEIFHHFAEVHYPEKHAGIGAVVHQNLEGKDFLPLEVGAPIFVTADGNSIQHAGDHQVYPVFINEAAYYDKNQAFSLTRKSIVSKVLDDKN